MYAQKNSCPTATAFGMDEHQSAYFFQKEPFCSEEEAKQMKRSIYEAAMEKVDCQAFLKMSQKNFNISPD